MAGEHPLDRKSREQRDQELAKAKLEGFERRRSEETEALARGDWPRDLAALGTAVQLGNEALQRDPRWKNQKYSYNSEPQSGGDVARAYVQLHDNGTARAVILEIRVTTTGEIKTSLRGGSNAGSYMVGQINVATWNELLARLHNELDR